MAVVQIKGRVPETTAALFDLAVDVKAQTAHVVRTHRGGVTRTVAFTQNAAVIAALTEWAEAVLAQHPDLARELATARLADEQIDPDKRRALREALTSWGIGTIGP
jgi:2-oxo-4-hydroxy-4-carboxy--5-ureidoimidazoline (OHCU) decarboxylase